MSKHTEQQEATKVVAHTYNLFPKTRFHEGKAVVNGEELPVRVTCVGHAKFPTYTYWKTTAENGQETVFYAKGDYRDQAIATK